MRRAGLLGVSPMFHTETEQWPLFAKADASSVRTVKLKDLVPAATNTVNATFVVLDKAAPTAARPHHAQQQARGGEKEATCLAVVADETAAAHFLLCAAGWCRRPSSRPTPSPRSSSRCGVCGDLRLQLHASRKVRRHVDLYLLSCVGV
ncbi:hypothetical protein BS78_09G166100 [Paspalum vaginatum]|nr:hypothetical protein BS78_09G166100 [Paspalum vaginatum]